MIQHQKNGQVTAFILFGILLLSIVIVLFLFLDGNAEEKSSEKTPANIGTVQQFLSSCAEQVSLFAVYKAGVQGGYINLPNPYFNSITPLAYGFISSRVLPSSQIVQQQITSFIKKELSTCYSVLKNFPQFNIAQEDESFVEVSINKKDVLVKIKTPLQFTSGQNKQTQSISYTKYLSIPLLTALEQTNAFLETKEKNWFSMDALLAMDANTTIFSEQDHLVFVHQMHESKSIRETPFLFAYALKME